MLLSSTALLAAGAPPGGASPAQGITSMLIPMAGIFIVFYFLLIRPQRKQQKKHQDMLAALKPGDKVITQGGIYGTVVGVDDQKVQLRVADQVKIEVAKHAVAGMQLES